jgi:hypothetical protein
MMMMMMMIEFLSSSSSLLLLSLSLLLVSVIITASVNDHNSSSSSKLVSRHCSNTYAGDATASSLGRYRHVSCLMFMVQCCFMWSICLPAAGHSSPPHLFSDLAAVRNMWMWCVVVRGATACQQCMLISISSLVVLPLR